MPFEYAASYPREAEASLASLRKRLKQCFSLLHGMDSQEERQMEFAAFIESVNKGELSEEYKVLNHPLSGHMEDGSFWGWKLQELAAKHLALDKPRIEVGQKETLVLWNGLPRVRIAAKKNAFQGYMDQDGDLPEIWIG